MVREIFLFPASPPSHMHSAINTQIWFLPYSLPLCCCSHNLPRVAMLAQHFRYINQESPNWQCQNKRRIELRFPRMKLSYPRGVQLSHLTKFECRPFINFLVTKPRARSSTLMWADISSGWEYSQLLTCWTHTGRASSTCHLPAELLLCLSLTLAFFAFSFSYCGISTLILSNKF